jgi:hypothetical protein
LIGGIAVLGVLVAPLGLPVAAFCAVPFAYAAIKRAAKNGAAAAYLKETGNFAPLLSDRELLKLTEIIGKSAVLAQLKDALEDGTPISEAGLDYLEACGINTAYVDLKSELAKFEQGEGAIDVKPIVVDVNTPVLTANGQTDLAKLMAERLVSRIICAAPRTGKGVLIVNALSHLKQLRPDVEIWAIDIKADPGENAYYTIFEPDKLLRINLMAFDKPDGADEAIANHFRSFQQSTTTTKLLWLNEAVTCAAKIEPKLWRNIQQFAIALCSAGATGSDGQTGRFLWIDTQSPNVSDLGLKTNASRNVFRRTFLTNEDRSLLTSAVGSGFALGIDESEIGELEATGSRVIAYDSLLGEWIALPHYKVSEPVAIAVNDGQMQSAIARFKQLLNLHPNQKADLFDDVAQSVTDPLLADFILWLKTKQGQVLSKRDVVLLWGNKKDRNITSNEKIQPLIDEVISIGLLAVYEDGYRVLADNV